MISPRFLVRLINSKLVDGFALKVKMSKSFLIDEALNVFRKHA